MLRAISSRELGELVRLLPLNQCALPTVRSGSAERRRGWTLALSSRLSSAVMTPPYVSSWQRQIRATPISWPRGTVTLAYGSSLNFLAFSIGSNIRCNTQLPATAQSAVRRSFQHLKRKRLHSVNVVNFQLTVFISNFMHMRDKTVCGF